MRSISGENARPNLRYGWAAVALFFLLAIALITARAMTREVSRDEQQFISAGALLLRGGLLPYVDYAYFHLPNLAYVYAGLFALSDHLLLVARSFNVLCGWLTLVLLFWLTARAFREAGSARLWIAGLAAAALLASPLFRFTSGRAWNHDFAVLMTTAAFAALLRAGDQVRARGWITACAALLGIAIGTRLTFLPLLLPFACMVAFTGGTARERVVRLAVFSSALAVALMPTLVLFARAPAQFLFDNFVYNGPLNRAYRVASGNEGVELSSKLTFIVSLLKFPHNLALLGAFAYLAIWRPTRNGWRSFLAEREVAAVVLCVPFLWIGAFAPSPSHKQYYYALVPFLVLGCVFGLARVWRNGEQRKPRFVAAIAAAVTVVALAIDLSVLRKLATPREWPPVRVHELGRELRAYTAGPVLTLSPIIALEGGANIYEEFATGRFAWRTAPFLRREAKAKFQMVDASTLEEFLAASPPAAILTGSTSTRLNQPLTAYARSHGYRHVRMSDDLDLWLRGL